MEKRAQYERSHQTYDYNNYGTYGGYHQIDDSSRENKLPYGNNGNSKNCNSGFLSVARDNGK